MMMKKMILTICCVLLACVASAYANPFVEGLEVYYGFNDQTLTDLSGNDRHGENQAGTIDFTSDVPAAIGAGNSLRLTNDGRFAVGNDYKGVPGSDNRTVAGWIKLNEHTTTDGIIVKWGDSFGDAGEKWTVRLDNLRLRAEVAGGATVYSKPFALDVWHHFAVVLNGDDLSDVRLYVNGAGEDSTGSQAINTADTEAPRIGARPVWQTRRLGDASLDHLAIWSRALSDAEILELHGGAVIPEPATLLMLGLGGVMCSVFRKRT